jgi:hypothetical protein
MIVYCFKIDDKAGALRLFAELLKNKLLNEGHAARAMEADALRKPPKGAAQ